MFENVLCHNCRSSESQYLFQSTERVCNTVPKNVWCGVVRCKHCDLIYLSPRVKEEEISQFYPQNEYYALQPSSYDSKLRTLKKDIHSMIAYLYFQYPENVLPTESKLPRSLLRVFAILSYRILKFRYRRLLPYRTGGKVLEFGFGQGDYLKKMKSLGWECWGVEISDSAIQVMEQNHIRAYSSVMNPSIPSRYFDWVTSYHSLEHVYNPKATLKKIHDILKPDGLLYLGVPNFDSVMARTFRSFWYDLGVPIHPYIFRTSSVKKMLSEAGFRIEKIYYRSLTQGLLGSLQIAFNAACGLLTGKKQTSMFLRDFLPAQLLSLPFVKFLDLLHLGDRIEIVAKRI